jgi:hypothetical protein
VSRQHIANRASITFIRRPGTSASGARRTFIEQKDGARTEIVAVGLDGMAVGRRAGRRHAHAGPVDERAPRRRQRLLHLGHRAARDPGGQVEVTTAAEPVPLHPSRTAAISSSRRAAARATAFRRHADLVLRARQGYTAWQRFDHNRIELVPERQTYKPGDTARIMIQSPWEQATALVTTEREGIRSHRQFTLTSTQQSIEMPITESDIPNVFVSVLLVKGRTVAPPAAATRRRSPTTTRAIRASRRSAWLRRAEGRGPQQAADRRRQSRTRTSTGRRAPRRCVST